MAHTTLSGTLRIRHPVGSDDDWENAQGNVGCSLFAGCVILYSNALVHPDDDEVEGNSCHFQGNIRHAVDGIAAEPVQDICDKHA